MKTLMIGMLGMASLVAGGSPAQAHRHQGRPYNTGTEITHYNRYHCRAYFHHGRRIRRCRHD